MDSNIQELIDKHWSYIQGLLRSLGADVSLDAIEYVYKTAFEHGYKHGRETLYFQPMDWPTVIGTGNFEDVAKYYTSEDFDIGQCD